MSQPFKFDVSHPESSAFIEEIRDAIDDAIRRTSFVVDRGVYIRLAQTSWALFGALVSVLELAQSRGQTKEVATFIADMPALTASGLAYLRSERQAYQASPPSTGSMQ